MYYSTQRNFIKKTKVLEHEMPIQSIFHITLGLSFSGLVQTPPRRISKSIAKNC